MAAASLQQCPVCGRDLADRPPPGRCPGCGFAYDADTRVWRSSESWGRIALVYAIVGLILGLIVTALYRLGVKQVPNPMLAVACAAFAPPLGLAIRRAFSGRITGRFVAVTPGGLLVGRRSRPELFPWNDFERLVERRGELRIQLRSTAVPITLDDIFADRAELEDFRQAVAQARRP